MDFVSPMIYTESPIAFKRDLALCKAAVPASALVPGIAACADEASPDRDSVRAQLEAADALKGVSFFALDWALGALCGYTDVKPWSNKQTATKHGEEPNERYERRHPNG